MVDRCPLQISRPFCSEDLVERSEKGVDPKTGQHYGFFRCLTQVKEHECPTLLTQGR